MRLGAIRNHVQLGMTLLLNFTAVGGVVVSAFLPILRLTSVITPFVPALAPAGQMHLCILGTAGRCFTGTWPFSLLLLALSGLMLVGLVVGRALCGWACPFGLIQDWMDKVRGRFYPARELPEPWHVRLIHLKYALLFFFTLLAVSLSLTALADLYAGTVYKSFWPDLCQASPYCCLCFPIAVNTMAGLFRAATPSFFGPYTVLQLLVLILFLVGAALIPRFWCRYLCWVGAVGSLFNRVSLLTLRKDTATCTRCGTCARVCPTRDSGLMRADTSKRMNDQNCIICLKCVESCPSRSLFLCIGKRPVYRGGSPWWHRS